MKAKLADKPHFVEPTPPELNLVLAVIERAKRDAAYKLGPGVKRRTITSEDQNSAQSFLRDLQSQYEASGASVKY